MWLSMFSIIIATKNELNYIGRTLAILKRVLRGFKAEILVVDSSIDGTYEVAKKLADKAYRFKEEGLSKARNYGAKKARGDILVFMDADTIVSKKLFEEALEAFKDPGVLAAVCYALPYSEANFIQKTFYLLDSTYIKLCRKFPFLLRLYNRGDFFAVRRKAFFKVGGFDENFHMMEITDFINRLMEHGKIVVLKSPAYESARRLKKWGPIKNFLFWQPHYLSYFMLSRPLKIEYENVR